VLELELDLLMEFLELEEIALFLQIKDQHLIMLELDLQDMELQDLDQISQDQTHIHQELVIQVLELDQDLLQPMELEQLEQELELELIKVEQDLELIKVELAQQDQDINHTKVEEEPMLQMHQMSQEHQATTQQAAATLNSIKEDTEETLDQDLTIPTSQEDNDLVIFINIL
jgi:hypothetical protein